MSQIKAPNYALRYQRERRNWTQEQAAEALLKLCGSKRRGEVNARMISKWERGVQTPNFEYREKLCELYGIPSPEELGFLKRKDVSHDAVAISSNSPIIDSMLSASAILEQPTIVSTSEEHSVRSVSTLPKVLPISTSPVDCAAWFGLKQAQIMASIHQYIGRMASCHELQSVLHHMIDTLDEAKTLFGENAYKLSRRQAIIAIAAQPLALFAGFQWDQQSSFPLLEEMLPQYAASITACWHLLQGRELSLVNEIVTSYLSTLASVANYSSKYQKTAATLATQCYRMHGIVALHRSDMNAVMSSFQKALRYSEIAKDSNFHVSALISFGYHLPSSLQSAHVYEKGLIHAQEIYPLLRSRLYVELAVAYASQNRRQEALRYLQFAQEAYPDFPERDPSFVYAEFGPSSMILEEGLLYLGLARHASNEDDAQQAWKTFARIEKPQSYSVSERIRVEIINYQAKTAFTLRNLENFCSYLEQGASGAKALESEKRRQEAIAIYKDARVVWSKESRVKELADLLL